MSTITSGGKGGLRDTCCFLIEPFEQVPNASWATGRRV